MKSQKILVVVSHGSKRKESNQEFKEFIKKLNRLNSERPENNKIKKSAKINSNNNYHLVKGAYLEFASPQLEKVIADAVEQDYKKIDILPLFIFAGYHVRKDIPERLQKLKEEFNELEYDILDHPAAGEGFSNFIFEKIIEK